MAGMEERVTLNYLLDFYGPLLTPHKLEIMRLYCEEDLSLQEIADQLEITRQGVFDAIAKARRQLSGYEEKLGLVARHRAQSARARECLEALSRLSVPESEAPALRRATEALEDMLRDGG